MKKPNLFIVGMPKAGTTSLHNYLSQHPQVFMSEPKEPNYFCTDFHQQSDKFHNKEIYFNYRIKNDYLNIFKNVNNEKIIGESSVLYFFSEQAPKNIKKFNPNAKIIIILREPTSYLFSLHAQLLHSQNETITNFETCLECESERKNEGKFIPKTTRLPFLLYYKDQIRYSNYINNYLKQFPKKNIKIIIFEQFKENPKQELDKITEFLNIKKFDPNLKIINQRTKPKNKIVQYLIKNPNLKIKKPLKLLPKPVQNKIYNTMLLINQKKSKDKINPETQSRLKTEFKPEIIKTNKLLNKVLDNKIDLIKLWRY